MRKASLFSGIGGIDLAGHWAGMETIVFCERESFPQKVLSKHWPDVPIIDDVHDFTRKELERRGIIGPGRAIDIISAGFPCQPFSYAGSREGSDDKRYLWPEVVRVLQDINPTWFIGENVPGLLSMAEPDGGAVVESRTVFRSKEEDLYEAVFIQQEAMLFGRICKDLEDIGYQVQPFVIPAAAVGAAHQRERVFILGYTEHHGSYGTTIRRGVDPASDYDTEGQDKARQSPGTSGREDNAAMGNSDCFQLQGQQPLRFRSLEGGSQTREHQGASYGAGQQRATQSGVGRDFDEFPSRVDGGGLNERTDEARPDQILPELRNKNGEEEVQRQAGRYGDLPQTKILRSDVYGRSESEREPRIVSSEETGDQTPQGQVRNVRNNRRFASSSLGRESSEQRPGEYHDALRPVSYKMALGARQNNSKAPQDIADWLDGFGMNPLDALINFIASYPQPALMGQEQHAWEPPRVATGIKNRAARIKALGNAVDPLQALPVLYGIKLIDDWLRANATGFKCEVRK